MNWRAFLQPRYLREASTVGSRVFGVAAGLITSGITAHALSPAQRGEYFYVVAMAGVLASFANLGIPSANAFFSARDAGLVRRLLIWSTVLAASTGLVVSGGFALATSLPALNKFGTVHDLWLTVMTSVVLGLALLGPLLAGQHRFGALNLLQLGQQGLLLIIFPLVGLFAPSPEAFLAASSLVAFAGLLAHIACIRWRAADPSPAAPPVSLDAWFRYGFRAFVILLLGALVSRLGVLFVRAYSDPHALGIYSVAVQLWDALSIVPSSLALILFPMIVRDGTLSWAHCRTEIARMALLTTVAAIGAAIVLRPAIPIVFGADYAEAYGVCLFFLPGFIAFSVLVVASQYLAGIGYPLRVTVNWGVAAGVLAATSPFAVSRWGAHGAAAATSLTYAGLAALMIHLAYQKLSRTTDSPHA